MSKNCVKTIGCVSNNRKNLKGSSKNKKRKCVIRPEEVERVPSGGKHGYTRYATGVGGGTLKEQMSDQRWGGGQINPKKNENLRFYCWKRPLKVSVRRWRG